MAHGLLETCQGELPVRCALGLSPPVLGGASVTKEKKLSMSKRVTRVKTAFGALNESWPHDFGQVI